MLEFVDRRQQANLKWAVRQQQHDRQLLPLWIADMDIAIAPSIQQAIQTVVDQHVWGYVAPSLSLLGAIQSWQRDHHRVEINKQELTLTTSVTTALAAALQVLTNPGEEVVVLAPYYPFYEKIVVANQRRLRVFSFLEDKHTYDVPWSALAAAFKQPSVTAFILCNPQNPGGQVWSAQALTQLLTLAKQFQVVVLADEIHNDLTYPAKASLASCYSNDVPVILQRQAVVCHSASKTFNLAGLKCAYLMTKNEQWRQQIEQQLMANQANEVNSLGLVATEAAFLTGEDWRQDVCTYLQANRDWLMHALLEALPKLKIMEPQASFLMWLDFRGYTHDEQRLQQLLRHRAHIWLNDGADFGPNGTGFMRLNFAVERSLLVEVVRRLKLLAPLLENESSV